MVATDHGYHDEEITGVDALQVQKRYGEERAKRLRDEGYSQFVDISLNEKFKSFIDDPCVDESVVKDAKAMFPDNRCQFLILGGGFGGLLYAIHMIKAGTRSEDIRIVDSAGGFGGTWYWNRYPGLSCDIESYMYLPLLKETGYIPRHRYSEGEEIRTYANLLAQKWGITESAVFQTQAQKLVWDETAKEWQIELKQQRSGKEPQILNICAPFVAVSNGVLNWAKIPGIPDKRVAIIGTGATATQTVPHVARWAKHLYVVQRTPASLAQREQRETDPEWFRKSVASSKGWQRGRLRNFHQHFTLEQPPAINMVDDEWMRGPGIEIPSYLEKLQNIDLPRLESIRKRVEDEVSDPAVAEVLKPWYPSWCKRPLFHDEYLSTFNRENITIVDTEGKGTDSLTTDSIVVGDQSYPVDIVIFATGFRPPFIGSPAEKANVSIVGRNDISMSEEWARNGPSTLHGVLDHNFPNLFLSGPWQASNSPNYAYTPDFMAKHSANIFAEAKRRADGKPFTVTVTKAAAEDWAMQMIMHSFPGAAVLGCTPGYINIEGQLDRAPPEQQMIMARSGVWGHGFESYARAVEEWYEKGNWQDIEVET
ncbi:FAD/NAD(P)-binding domain-containing protein [Bimuria novae-zelandiae CBS 107.79]|uniref:FAD/NAD(P)-binding domain-containing protein n=1 Tax=Bimuria novae-zelandiae CBS 107.79 TaxID=1447943 RepID=A0A6A5VB27_9PLEO|nr:FAD/NAD(P)-binding domain-containing protein [Bimuria novae-zelandiae CBS 107.79]